MKVRLSQCRNSGVAVTEREPMAVIISLMSKLEFFPPSFNTSENVHPVTALDISLASPELRNFNVLLAFYPDTLRKKETQLVTVKEEGQEHWLLCKQHTQFKHCNLKVIILGVTNGNK